MPAFDATTRFSDRVENYALYRPGYPPEVLKTLRSECGLMPSHMIADIASGTGIWTRLLLDNGNRVFGVEPNAKMREAGERMLASFPNFTSVAGTAEATGLAGQSIDFITAAQAGHWFDRAKAKQEFLRILRPGGWLVLLWNERVTDSTEFLRAYEQMLLKYGTDYQEIRHERTTAEIHQFFDPAPFQDCVFENRQEVDYEGAEGRLLSSSYAPGPDHSRHTAMLRELRRIFEISSVKDRIAFDYKTRVYFGRLR
jgi:SAM-dependent methyltransferase